MPSKVAKPAKDIPLLDGARNFISKSPYIVRDIAVLNALEKSLEQLEKNKDIDKTLRGLKAVFDAHKLSKEWAGIGSYQSRIYKFRSAENRVSGAKEQIKQAIAEKKGRLEKLRSRFVDLEMAVCEGHDNLWLNMEDQKSQMLSNSAPNSMLGAAISNMDNDLTNYRIAYDSGNISYILQKKTSYDNSKKEFYRHLDRCPQDTKRLYYATEKKYGEVKIVFDEMFNLKQKMFPSSVCVYKTLFEINKKDPNIFNNGFISILAMVFKYNPIELEKVCSRFLSDKTITTLGFVKGVFDLTEAIDISLQEKNKAVFDVAQALDVIFDRGLGKPEYANNIEKPRSASTSSSVSTAISRIPSPGPILEKPKRPSVDRFFERLSEALNKLESQTQLVRSRVGEHSSTEAFQYLIQRVSMVNEVLKSSEKKGSNAVVQSIYDQLKRPNSRAENLANVFASQFKDYEGKNIITNEQATTYLKAIKALGAYSKEHQLANKLQVERTPSF